MRGVLDVVGIIPHTIGDIILVLYVGIPYENRKLAIAIRLRKNQAEKKLPRVNRDIISTISTRLVPLVLAG